MVSLQFESRKGRKLTSKDDVKVYRNLSKDCISIMKTGNIHGYAKSVKLMNVSFKVSKAGQNRVRREKTKNVHAYVIGKIHESKLDIQSVDDEYSSIESKGYFRVYYNPYKVDSFVLYETMEPIHHADEAIVIMDRVYIKNGIQGI